VLTPIVEKLREYKKWERIQKEAEETLESETDADIRELAEEERQTALETCRTLTEELKILLLPRDENDDRNVIIEIRGGAGGEEAALFCAVLSGIIGFYTATSRLLYSVAKEGVLPKSFAKLHPKYKTPYVAILFVMIVSLVAPWFGRNILGWVVDMSSTGAAIGYGFTSAATFYTICKYKDAGIGLKINAILGTIFSAAFIAMLLSPASAGFGGLGAEPRIALAIWIVLGIAFYLISRKQNKAK
jgi:hypothetical protein